MLIVFFPLKLDDSASVTLVSSRPQMFLPDAPINKRRSVGWPSSNLVSSLRFFFCFSFFFLSMATCVDKCHPMVSPLQAPRSFCWLVGLFVCLFVFGFSNRYDPVPSAARPIPLRYWCCDGALPWQPFRVPFVGGLPPKKKKSSSLVFFSKLETWPRFRFVEFEICLGFHRVFFGFLVFY